MKIFKRSVDFALVIGILLSTTITTSYAADLRPIWNVEMKAAPAILADKSDCPDGWFCLFSEKNYQGRMVKFYTGGELRHWNFRDDAESYVNRTGCHVKVTDFKWGRDRYLWMSPNVADSDMGDQWRNKADRVEVQCRY